ncbi:hypothetical protein EC973_008974 [Apophysomyces ossiformis]|uniref:Uncharacterized protein n=1 Tax=Apophysomyces ossiformis TaxID=679940 RepID=A0A8H7BSR3_9FUNG|nr:hypothetical protein EC973_008974 [Apophysomyces ossiformis]
MAVQFLALQSLVVCPTLLSVHWTGAGAASKTQWALTDSNDPLYDSHFNVSVDQFRSNSTLYNLSIANVPNNNSIVWIHVALIFIISIGWLWLLFVNHWHHLHLLQATGPTEFIHDRSVLIMNVPHHLRNAASLRHHFQMAQIGEVESVTLVSHTASRALDRAFDKRQKALDQLEYRLITLARSVFHPKQESAMRWMQLPAKLLVANQPVDDIHTILQEIHRLDQQIEQLKDVDASPEYYMPTGTAFVTFS